MPGKHAVLSPSASERWLSCPASVRLSQRAPKQPESAYAAEGTTAHALLEIEGQYAFGQITKRQYDLRFEKWLKGAEMNDYDILEMRRHINEMVEFLKEQVAEAGPHAQIAFEQRMATGIESCWGTGDVVIYGLTVVKIIDLKYGAGVPVDAENNSQLRLYGCGALDTFGDLLGDTETVETIIYQPRLESITSETLTAQELRDWREEIRPIAAEALAGSERFGPSEKACRWCPVAATCRVRVEQATSVDFGSDPDLLTPEEVADYLSQADDIVAWVNALKDYALDEMYSQGHSIPGWKVVRTNGRRSITDPDKAIDALVKAGVDEDEITKVSIVGLGDLEKIVGKKDLPAILGDLLVKSEGKPAIAPTTDKRSSISPNDDAAADFSQED